MADLSVKVETFYKPVIFASRYRPTQNTNNELLFEETNRLNNTRQNNLISIDGGYNLLDED